MPACDVETCFVPNPLPPSLRTSTSGQVAQISGSLSFLKEIAGIMPVSSRVYVSTHDIKWTLFCATHLLLPGCLLLGGTGLL